MVIINSKKFIFLIFILTISFISAAYTIGKEKYSIEKIYSTGDDLRGWINISFNEEPSNSIFSSSDGGEIELLNLLKKSLNKNFKYTCDLKDCKSDYSAEDGELEKIYNLREGESVIFGVKITDGNQLDSIESLQFKLESNNAENTKNPLFIDFLNNGINEWKSHYVSENYGEYNFGCFSSSTETTLISSALYCERITFEEAAGIEIGAYMTRESGEGEVPFIIGISNLDTGNTVTCEASASEEIGVKEKIACKPNFQIKESGEYHVCIGLKNPTADANKYKINFEETNPCGFAGTYDGEYDFDFEIFGRQNKYAPNINIIFNNTELENSQSEVTNIEDYLEGYIEEKYENNCTTGCIIPIKIIANANQKVKISELSLSYLAGIQKEIDEIFDVEEKYPVITATHQKLFLDEAGFNVSNIEKEYNVSVYFNGDELIEEEIKVEKAPVIYYVRPEITARKYPTTFSIKISQPTGISKYKWNFSDGVVTTTTVPEVSHTYAEMGKYPLIITLTNSKGMNFSSEFEINVGSASEVVPSLLSKIDSNIRFLESKFVVFSEFQKRSLINALGLEEIKEKVETLEENSKNAITESNYEEILNEILKIKLPETVGESFVGEGINFYPYTDVVNLEVLKIIGGGSYNPSKEQEYQEAILSWEIDNAEMELNFSEISAVYQEYQEPIVKIFEVSINNFYEEPIYFIIKDMENLLFYTDYPLVSQDGYKYLEIDSTQSIIFSTTEEIDFEELPIFVSPSLTEINILDLEEFNQGEFFKKWGLFILIIVGILVFTFVIYIVLQIWYKKKYEEYLFKNRNNLYNLVNYIKTSFANGMKESEIERNLKKAKWNSEQIRYAMRKYHGKNTGMPEIPVKKIVKRKKENS
jgi:PKD repeat protein